MQMAGPSGHQWVSMQGPRAHAGDELASFLLQLGKHRRCLLPYVPCRPLLCSVQTNAFLYVDKNVSSLSLEQQQHQQQQLLKMSSQPGLARKVTATVGPNTFMLRTRQSTSELS